MLRFWVLVKIVILTIELAMQHRAGKYLLWTLFGFNAFLLVTFLYIPHQQNTQYSTGVQECFKDCMEQTGSLYDRLYFNKSSEKSESVTTLKSLITTAKPINLPTTVIVQEETTQASPRHKADLILPELENNNPWRECPKPDLGRKSTFLTCSVDGRLGNVVWNYLSIFAGARRHNLRPIMNRSSNDFLYNVFDRSAMRIPTVEEMDFHCNTSQFFTNLYKGTVGNLMSRKDLFRLLEEPPTKGYQMLKYSWYAVATEDLVPYWNELKSDLVLREEFTMEATLELGEFRQIHMNRTHMNDTKEAEQLFEFVGVHVRRTDYMHHMSIVYPGSTSADAEYYRNAMNWMAKTVKKRLIFIVVSDDRLWANAHIVSHRNDSYSAGDGDITSPGLDLALLGACNHTIFAYGTFGLTAALLASQPGGYTVIFDPLNGTVTKEMEFAANLPGWRIMDSKGNFNYENKKISYEYYLHPKML